MKLHAFPLLMMLFAPALAHAFDQLDGGVPIGVEAGFFGGDFKKDKIASGDPGRADAQVFLPTNYDPSKKYPVVLLLHGYSETQGIINTYVGLDAEVTKKGFILVVPEGLKDTAPSPGPYHYWNASDACCDFAGKKFDDRKYLTNLMDQTATKYSVDKSRVYAIGHSNGAFMAHNLACGSSDHFAAIVAFAGMTTKDPGDCKPTSPVSLLQINAVDDGTIHFEGGKNPDPMKPYPSAQESVNRWVSLNHCAPDPTPGPQLDLTLSIPGKDASSRTWSGCQGGAVVKQDTIQKTDPNKIPFFVGLLPNTLHFPVLTAGFTEEALNFLLSKRKQLAAPVVPPSGESPAPDHADETPPVNNAL